VLDERRCDATTTVRRGHGEIVDVDFTTIALELVDHVCGETADDVIPSVAVNAMKWGLARSDARYLSSGRLSLYVVASSKASRRDADMRVTIGSESMCTAAMAESLWNSWSNDVCDS
jgi:hypothetical protein